MTKVKICGITSLDDALVAVDAGADALGFVFFDKSPRNVEPEAAARIIAALPPFVQVVGLFVNADLDFVNATADRCRLDIVQLHGEESPSFCQAVHRRVMKAFRVRGMESLAAMSQYRVSAYLLDAYSPNAYGGTGARFDWDCAVAAKSQGQIVLAGGGWILIMLPQPLPMWRRTASMSPAGWNCRRGARIPRRCGAS